MLDRLRHAKEAKYPPDLRCVGNLGGHRLRSAEPADLRFPSTARGMCGHPLSGLTIAEALRAYAGFIIESANSFRPKARYRMGGISIKAVPLSGAGRGRRHALRRECPLDTNMPPVSSHRSIPIVRLGSRVLRGAVLLGCHCLSRVIASRAARLLRAPRPAS